jgi:putative photosynthetic complex assembly protein 2
VGSYIWPVLFALFVWWFSTGAIIYLNCLPTRTFRWSLAGATGVLAGAIYALAVSAWDTSLAGTYIAFTATLLIWGWLEITFYMGLVTGPRKVACAHGCKGMRHFGHALMASLWHEIAIVIAGLVVLALCYRAPNDVAVGTFLTLWWMHESARLNVFLGVPNRAEHFLPAHLAYLKSFFRHRDMNLLFPVSISVSTASLALIVQAALAQPADTPAAHALSLIGALMALAILEHWFLVIPLDASKLWNWSLTARGRHQPDRAEDTLRIPGHSRGLNPTPASTGGRYEL